MSQDSPTEINEFEQQFLSLKKELDHRADDALEFLRNNPDSMRNFRREIEREYRAEIRQLREESAHKDLEIAHLRADIAAVREWMTGHNETLTAAKMIVHAGMVFRWGIIAIVGITAAIGGISAATETIRSWLQK